MSVEVGIFFIFFVFSLGSVFLFNIKKLTLSGEVKYGNNREHFE